MYEFHGWAVIRETPEEIDAGNLAAIIKDIQSFISSLSWSGGLLKIYPANGNYYLAVGGLLNHKTAAEAEELMKVYQLIAQKAAGSYGLLYARDDEDMEGYDNKFRAFVLAHGELQIKEDVFLIDSHL